MKKLFERIHRITQFEKLQYIFNYINKIKKGEIKMDKKLH